MDIDTNKTDTGLLNKGNESNNDDKPVDKLNGHHEAEQQQEHIPYPKNVFFIIGNEFCERFCYYGMRTILSLYLTEILLYNESDAMVIYHTFSILVMFFPILGAIISDGYIGMFNTIFYVSMIYALGNVVLALAAAEPVGLPQRPFTIVALLLIAVGTGGIKPCVAAFGGDQFILPQQEKQFERYFQMFYFSINAGSFISTFLTPVLREDVHCFGANSCYPLAFAVPGVLMIIAIVIFALGKPSYTIKKPESNVIGDFIGCLWVATKGKITDKENKVEHWLDRAKPKYGEKFVQDVKDTLAVLLLFAPLPIFWSLYDQQGTAWIFQAVRMNGDIGFYTILPDQMQVMNPILILAFIPLFSYWIYPALAKCGILRTSLQKICCGGFLAALAFILSAFVARALEATDPVLPTTGNAQFRIFNSLNCNVTLNTTINLDDTLIEIPSMDFKKIDHRVCERIIFTIHDIDACDEYQGPGMFSFNVNESTAYGFYLNQNSFVQYEDDIQKDDNGLPRIRTIASNIKDRTVNITFVDSDGGVALRFPITNIDLYTIDPGTYKVNGSDREFELELGGVYTAIIRMDDNNNPSELKLLTITEPNSIHMLWQLPQIVVITIAEIMFSITALEFTYSQAPQSMKSVLQAANLLTDSLGNVIIVIIEAVQIFDKQSSEFFLYSGLMVLDVLILVWLSARYKYVALQVGNNGEAVADSSLKELAPVIGETWLRDTDGPVEETKDL